MTADPRDAEIARYDLDLMESRMVKDQWGGEWVRHSDHAAEIAQLRAERDAALAQVAGAYEAMIRWLIEAGVAGDAPEDPLATCLRALTPASALAALSRRDAQMRAEGMREAAEMAYGRTVHEHYVEWPWRGTGNRGRESELGLFARDLSATILAAAEKGAPDAH